VYYNKGASQITRLITNHALIGEYWCHFFPQEKNICLEINACLCREVPLKTHNCIIYNYVRLISNTLTDIIGFLQGNLALSASEIIFLR